jgi:type I restriction enzyme S subunit
LSTLADVRPSNVDKKSLAGEEAVRLCNYMDVYANDYIRESIDFMHATATPAEIGRFKVERGDVLLTKDSETPDDIGVPSVVTDDIPGLVCGYHLALLKPRSERVDSTFLAKQLASTEVSRYFSRRANGTTRYGLSYGSIAGTPIRLAPLSAQHRIAEILVTIDDAIEQTEAVIAKTQQIKAGLMHDLLSRGVTPDGQLRPPCDEAPQLYKGSPLGPIPTDWHVAPIGALFSRSVERGIPGLPIMAITMEAGLVPRESVERRVESKLALEAHLLVRRGDIAYNMMRMWQGVLGRAEHDGLVSPAYVVMKPGPGIDSLFAKYLLSAESSIREFKRLSYGVVDDRLRLYARDLLRIELALPREVHEQREIASRLQAIDASLAATQEAVEKYRAEREGLAADLLTGRVRVPTGALEGSLGV